MPRAVFLVKLWLILFLVPVCKSIGHYQINQLSVLSNPRSLYNGKVISTKTRPRRHFLHIFMDVCYFIISCNYYLTHLYISAVERQPSLPVLLHTDDAACWSVFQMYIAVVVLCTFFNINVFICSNDSSNTCRIGVRSILIIQCKICPIFELP